MPVHIREYTKSDMFRLTLICNDEWSKNVTQIAVSLKNYKEDGIERCYLAEEDDMIIGFIYGFALPNGLLLPQFLYVKQEKRRIGVGRQLLEYLEKNSGCTSSMIYYNEHLHNHYAKLGYSTQENLETARKWLITQDNNFYQSRQGEEK